MWNPDIIIGGETTRAPAAWVSGVAAVMLSSRSTGIAPTGARGWGGCRHCGYHGGRPVPAVFDADFTSQLTR